MPCVKCSNGKWRLGSGDCRYSSKEACERAYKAYRARQHDNGKKKK